MRSKIKTFVAPKISIWDINKEVEIKSFFIDKILNGGLGIPLSYKLYDKFNRECVFFTAYDGIKNDIIRDIKGLFSDSSSMFVQSNILKYVLEYDNNFIDNITDSLITEDSIPLPEYNKTFHDDLLYILYSFLRINEDVTDTDWYKEYFKEEDFKSCDIDIIKKNFKESLTKIFTTENNILVNLLELFYITNTISIKVDHKIIEFTVEETTDVDNHDLKALIVSLDNGVRFVLSESTKAVLIDSDHLNFELYEDALVPVLTNRKILLPSKEYIEKLKDDKIKYTVIDDDCDLRNYLDLQNIIDVNIVNDVIFLNYLYTDLRKSLNNVEYKYFNINQDSIVEKNIIEKDSNESIKERIKEIVCENIKRNIKSKYIFK